MIYSALKGRIGNNLFQIAAGISLATKYKAGFAAYIRDIMLPMPDNCSLYSYLEQFRNNLLRNIQFINSLEDETKWYLESDNSYSEIVYNDNLVIDGYFQSEKYFDKQLVRSVFSIDQETFRYIMGKYENIPWEEITALNVRRGDFLKIPDYHPVCSMYYYRSAIKYFKKGSKFLVISDDIAWCKKKFKGQSFYFIEDEEPVVDLYIQTLCRNNIISNSSFSWWGAWLNSHRDKIVIAPADNWVGPSHTYSNNDLLPEEWILLSNPLGFKIKMNLLFFKILKSFKLLIKSIIPIDL